VEDEELAEAGAQAEEDQVPPEGRVLLEVGDLAGRGKRVFGGVEERRKKGEV
jgi:hypothetical protein